MTEELAQIEITKTLTEESPKVRKRKLLTNLDSLWAKCQVCKETGNLENLVRHQLPVKNELGVELYNMNESKTTQIKKIVAKIDISKIDSYLRENPKSKTLKEIVKYSKKALDSSDEKVLFKLGTDLAYELDTLVNKTGYVKNEEEKKFWLEISRELFKNTIGVRDKK